MDNNVYPLFVLFQNKIFGNIYMNKIYVYKNRLYQIEFKKFQFDTAPCSAPERLCYWWCYSHTEITACCKTSPSAIKMAHFIITLTLKFKSNFANYLK